MARRIIAYDLGTGGAKASLYGEDGACLRSAFLPYETRYPDGGWRAIVEPTQQLLEGQEAARVEGLAISGQSLGAVPVDGAGGLLREWTPTWSDTRASAQARAFFARVDPQRRFMVHAVEAEHRPRAEAVQAYARHMKVFERVREEEAVTCQQLLDSGL